MQVDTRDRVKQLRIDVQRTGQANTQGLIELRQASYDQNSAIYQQVTLGQQDNSKELRLMEQRIDKGVKKGVEQVLGCIQAGLVSMLASSPLMDHRTQNRKSDDMHQCQLYMTIMN